MRAFLSAVLFVMAALVPPAAAQNMAPIPIKMIAPSREARQLIAKGDFTIEPHGTAHQTSAIEDGPLVRTSPHLPR